MSELINFRDFGGYTTKEGKKIKKGIFFRSGSYRDITKEDLEYIQSLNIQNVHDFREGHEIDPREPHQKFAKHVHMISASEHLGGFEEEENMPHSELTSESMKEFYALLPFDNPAYKEVFRVLQEDNAVPYLHNCTAGKDRTGIATALIQLVLGLDWETVMLDYMKSMNAFDQIYQNEVRRLKPGREEASLLYKMPGLVIMPTFLESAFDAIYKRYGTIEAYLDAEFGLDEDKINALRLKYTE